MKIIISHARPEQKLARDLATRLTKAGYEVWNADQEIIPGQNWALQLGEALEESDAMVVLLSPGSMKSEWVRNDINFALGSPNYAGRLIPVIVRPTADIPWILDALEMVDVSDVRDDSGKVANRILKQLAKRLQRAEK